MPKLLPPSPCCTMNTCTLTLKKKASACYCLPALLHNRKLLWSSLHNGSTLVSESIGTTRTITLENRLVSSQSRHSVLFETKVTIHEYEKWSEQYIHDGWSEQVFLIDKGWLSSYSPHYTYINHVLAHVMLLIVMKVVPVKFNYPVLG